METIENIGQYLKNTREERKIPIAQVAQALKTKLETIQALEANDFSKIPAPTYVKGYLRSYANYLGIDSDHLIAEYNRQYPTESKQVLILQGKKLPSVGLDAKKLIRPKILIPVGIIIGLLISIVFFITTTPKKQIIHTKKPIEEPQKVSPTTITTPITTPISLCAHPLENVWLRVYSDGKLIFEGTLKKGDEETWQAQNELRLRIGNPGKLNLTLNGRSIGTVSPYGPVNVVINEKGVNVEK